MFKVKSNRRGIFVATMFKSGTKLLERILDELSPKKVRPIGMDIGSDYRAVDVIKFNSDEIFIWHSIPTSAHADLLTEKNAYCIFLIRNVYDLLVSQYYHFALDVDVEIGFGVGSKRYFEAMSANEGISLVLNGASSNSFYWSGFGEQLYQMQEMTRYSLEKPSLLLTYEELVADKANQINRIANFIDVKISNEQLSHVVAVSEFISMKSQREIKFGSGNHFRRGVFGKHGEVLQPFHYDMVNLLLERFAPELPSLCAQVDYLPEIILKK